MYKKLNVSRASLNPLGELTALLRPPNSVGQGSVEGLWEKRREREYRWEDREAGEMEREKKGRHEEGRDEQGREGEKKGEGRKNL